VGHGFDDPHEINLPAQGHYRADVLPWKTERGGVYATQPTTSARTLPFNPNITFMESSAAVFNIHSGGLKPGTPPVRFALQMGKNPFSERLHLINRRRQEYILLKGKAIPYFLYNSITPLKELIHGR